MKEPLLGEGGVRTTPGPRGSRVGRWVFPPNGRSDVGKSLVECEADLSRNGRPPWWGRTGSVKQRTFRPVSPVCGATQMERRGFLLVGAVAILGLMPLWVMLIGGTLRSANIRRSVRVRGFCCDGARNGVWQRTSRKRATLTSPRTVSAQGTSMEGKGGTQTAFKCTEPGRLQEVSGALSRQRVTWVSQGLRS